MTFIVVTTIATKNSTKPEAKQTHQLPKPTRTSSKTLGPVLDVLSPTKIPKLNSMMKVLRLRDSQIV